MPPATRLARNPALLCAFHALQMSLFPMAIITLFFKNDIGMSMQEIFLLQGAFGLAMAVFEFPSGYLADRFGYRRTLLLASLMNAVGWTLYTRADSLPDVVLAEVVLGVAISLISGTDTALMYESLSESGREADFGRWAGRMKFFGQFGEGTAAIVAGFLYATWSRGPFALEVGIWGVNLIVAWRLVEPLRHRPALTDNWKQVRGMVSFMFRESAKLRGVVALAIALGMASFVPVWTIQLYATDAGLDEAKLGIVWAAANYTVALGSLASATVAARLGRGRLLLACIGLVAIGYAGLGLTHAVWGFAFYFVLTLMRGLNTPVLYHEEQRLIPSSDRAGFVSLRSLVFRGSFLVVAAAFGPAVDRWGQHPVLLVLGAVLVAAALAALVSVRRHGVLEEGA